MRVVLSVITTHITRFNNVLKLYNRFSTRPVFDPNAHFRAKVIPKEIWAEENDPKYTPTEEVKGHWHYVEQLFPQLRVPTPPKQSSNAGWKAPPENVPALPYFVGRSRNHMLPVYEARVYKDRVLVTQITKVQGDIYLFEYDLKMFLEEKLGEAVQSHVNEIACYVNVKGNCVDMIKEWLYNKGF